MKLLLEGCYVVFFSAWLDSLFFIIVVVDLILMLEIFLFDIFDIFWICFISNYLKIYIGLMTLSPLHYLGSSFIFSLG